MSSALGAPESCRRSAIAPSAVRASDRSVPTSPGRQPGTRRGRLHGVGQGLGALLERAHDAIDLRSGLAKRVVQAVVEPPLDDRLAFGQPRLRVRAGGRARARRHRARRRRPAARARWPQVPDRLARGARRAATRDPTGGIARRRRRSTACRVVPRSRTPGCGPARRRGAGRSARTCQDRIRIPP